METNSNETSDNSESGTWPRDVDSCRSVGREGAFNFFNVLLSIRLASAPLSSSANVLTSRYWYLTMTGTIFKRTQSDFSANCCHGRPIQFIATELAFYEVFESKILEAPRSSLWWRPLQLPSPQGSFLQSLLRWPTRRQLKQIRLIFTRFPFHDSHSLEAFTLLDRVKNVTTKAFENWNRAINDGI